MKRAEIHGINPYTTHLRFVAFLDTLFGESYSVEFPGINSPPLWEGHVKNDEYLFAVFAGPGQKPLDEILPNYLDGALKAISNVVGYLFFLHPELLDFDAKPDIPEHAAGLNSHILHCRFPDSPFLYTACVKDFVGYFRQTVPDAPYLIALAYENGNPGIDVLDVACCQLRNGLSLAESTPVLAIDTSCKADCQQAVMTLINAAGDFPDRENFVPLLEALV